MRDAAVGVLGLLGAVMAFGGAAAAGALLGVFLSARRRLRGPWRLVAYALATGALLFGGTALTRPEARGVVAIFAVAPFLVGLLFAVLDLRRQRG